MLTFLREGGKGDLGLFDGQGQLITTKVSLFYSLLDVEDFWVRQMIIKDWQVVIRGTINQPRNQVNGASLSQHICSPATTG